MNSDVLAIIASKLEICDLLNFSRSSKKNKLVCERNDVWSAKLHKDFPNYQNLKPNPKDNYRLLYGLTQLKEKLNLEQDIYKKIQERILDMDSIYH